MKGKLLLLLMSAMLLYGNVCVAAPIGTAFTYHGQLHQNGQPATNGIYGIRFSLYDAATTPPGVLVGSESQQSVPVTNSIFTVSLDFGAGAFSADARWLEISVNTNSVSPTPGYLVLTPRTRVTPTPNAIYASTAGTVTNAAIQAGHFAAGTPIAGQVLGYDGISLLWQPPGVPGGLTLPFAGTAASPNGAFQVNNSGSGAASDGIVGTSASSASQVSGVRGVASSASGVVVGVYGRATNSPGGTGIVGYGGATGGYFTSTQPGGRAGVFDGNVTVNGNVGVGTATPQAALDVRGNWDAQRPALQLGGEKPTIKFAPEPVSGNQTWLLHLGSEGPGNLTFMHLTGFVYDRVLTLGANNNVGIGTPSPQSKLDVNGTTRTCVLEITGGCDLAEPFPMKEEVVEKGSVVVIDDEHPGRLQRSTRAYDTRVAGIVSGANGVNPGISLKQAGALDQGENVALTGRVYVKADASFAAIKAGDLLTTSDMPGHAMKVTDHARAQGAILGKAMSALNDGTGLVLVLVTLQ